MNQSLPSVWQVLYYTGVIGAGIEQKECFSGLPWYDILLILEPLVDGRAWQALRSHTHGDGTTVSNCYLSLHTLTLDDWSA